MNGRNHTTNGLGTITEAASGFPSSNGHIPFSSTPFARGILGHVVLSASFENEGDTMPAEGALTLPIREQAVGSGRVRTQPGRFSIAGEGLNVGREGAEPVTDDYPGDAPWAFVGTIHKATRQPIVEFVERVTREGGPAALRPRRRVRQRRHAVVRTPT
jgi:hypothetical protein